MKGATVAPGAGFGGESSDLPAREKEKILPLCRSQSVRFTRCRPAAPVRQDRERARCPARQPGRQARSLKKCTIETPAPAQGILGCVSLDPNLHAAISTKRGLGFRAMVRLTRPKSMGEPLNCPSASCNFLQARGLGLCEERPKAFARRFVALLSRIATRLFSRVLPRIPTRRAVRDISASPCYRASSCAWARPSGGISGQRRKLETGWQSIPQPGSSLAWTERRFRMRLQFVTGKLQ